MTDRIKIDVPQYMRQLAAACREQQKFHDELRKRGWQFNEALQIWTHPDIPGSEIML